jgi:hypothetical protein
VGRPVHVHTHTRTHTRTHAHTTHTHTHTHFSLTHTLSPPSHLIIASDQAPSQVTFAVSLLTTRLWRARPHCGRVTRTLSSGRTRTLTVAMTSRRLEYMSTAVNEMKRLDWSTFTAHSLTRREVRPPARLSVRPSSVPDTHSRITRCFAARVCVYVCMCVCVCVCVCVSSPSLHEQLCTCTHSCHVLPPFFPLHSAFCSHARTRTPTRTHTHTHHTHTHTHTHTHSS